MSKTGHILAVEFHEHQRQPEHGYTPSFGLDLYGASLWIGPRPLLEERDPRDHPTLIAQVIPYVVLTHEGKVLVYRRTSSGGEGRLHGRISIGVGGHIDLVDVRPDDEGAIDFERTLNEAAAREASEEVSLSILPQQVQWTGRIYDRDTPVGRVHYGMVGTCELNSDQMMAIANNDEIDEYRMIAMPDIEATFPDDTIEEWSRFIIEHHLQANMQEQAA